MSRVDEAVIIASSSKQTQGIIPAWGMEHGSWCFKPKPVQHPLYGSGQASATSQRKKVYLIFVLNAKLKLLE